MVLATRRLQLRRFTLADASFILELLNDAAFIRYIGDKGVRTLANAKGYLENGPLASYATFDFGLYLVVHNDGDVPIGMCGLLKRPTLDAPDIGYAFLPAFTGHGYATEATAAVLQHEQAAHGLQRIVAITSPDNVASQRVLEKAGLYFDRRVVLNEGDHPVDLFVWHKDASS